MTAIWLAAALLALSGAQEYNGSSNNVAHPEWGAAGSAFLPSPSSLAPPAAPPPERNVSWALFAEDALRDTLMADKGLNGLLWGAASLLIADLVCLEDVNETAVAVPAGDPWFDDAFPAAAAAGDNCASAYLDGGSLYGHTAAEALARREGAGGRVLNYTAAEGHPATQAVAAVLLREHNRVAAALLPQTDDDDDDALYWAARRNVTALLQTIAFHEVLPALFDGEVWPYEGYNASLQAGVDAAMALAGADALLAPDTPDLIPRLDAAGAALGATDLREGGALDLGLDALLRGLWATPLGLADASRAHVAVNLWGVGARASAGRREQADVDVLARALRRGRAAGLPAESSSDALLARLYPDSGGQVDAAAAALRDPALAAAMLERTFRRARDADRFFAGPGGDSLAAVIHRNSGAGERLGVHAPLPATTDWGARSDAYERVTAVDFASLAWTLSADGLHVDFLLQSAYPGGWVAVGVPSDPARPMAGADLLVAYLDPATGAPVVEDRWADALGSTRLDASQDVSEVAGGVDGDDGLLWVSFRRARDTGHAAEDLPLDGDSHTLTFAARRADADPDAYHGGLRAVAADVNLFGPRWRGECSAADWTYSVGACSADQTRAVTFAWVEPKLCVRGALPADAVVQCDWVAMSPTVGVILGATAAQALLALGFLAWTGLNLGDRIVNHSQPWYLALLVLGSLVAYSYVLAPVGEPTPSRCAFKYSAMNLGFAIFFSSLCAKTHAIYRIFVAGLLRRLQRVQRDSVCMLAAMLGFQVTVFALWLLVDPPTVETWFDSSISIDGVLIERTRCVPGAGAAHEGFVNILSFYNVVLVAIGCRLAWRVRNVKQGFAESRFIFAAVATISFIGAQIFLLNYSVELTPEEEHKVESMAVDFGVTLSLSLIFVPKIINVKLGKQKLLDLEAEAMAAGSAEERLEAQVLELQRQIEALHGRYGVPMEMVSPLHAPSSSSSSPPGSPASSPSPSAASREQQRKRRSLGLRTYLGKKKLTGRAPGARVVELATVGEDDSGALAVAAAAAEAGGEEEEAEEEAQR